MLTLPPSTQIFLATTPQDLRKGFDGLVALVQHVWKQDVFRGHLFVFFGRRKDRIKVLFWDRGGFVLYYKRLERGCFRLPKLAKGANSLALEACQLAMLLDGLDFGQVKRPRRWSPPPVQESLA